MPEKDKDGNLYDPVVIPEYEERLRRAHDDADEDEIEFVQSEYTDARNDYAKRREEFQRKHRDGEREPQPNSFPEENGTDGAGQDNGAVAAQTSVTGNPAPTSNAVTSNVGNIGQNTQTKDIPGSVK